MDDVVDELLGDDVCELLDDAEEEEVGEGGALIVDEELGVALVESVDEEEPLSEEEALDDSELDTVDVPEA